ncbi:hypothetical protein NFI96_029698 [Prochilodus magdalenae]|nr:hypothetical protein NFI96_029698 [Prochilodus magdalenae]
METLGVLALLLLGVSAVVSTELPAPRIKSIQTLNTNYTLRWEWDGGPDSGDVTFTAEYLARFKIKKSRKYNWTTVCPATSDLYCDFTAENLYYYGIWILHVRAQNGSLASSWAEVQFCPDRDAAIGPPSAVVLSPVKGLLQVAISDPVSHRNASMKDLAQDMYYVIQYWKEPLETQTPDNLTTRNNLVILPDLESWTWYCVRVQSRYDFYDKASAFSPTYCEQTDGQMPYWQIFLYFLLSLALSFLCVLGFSLCFMKSFKVVKNIFYPSIPLPTHIQEYLCDSPGSDMPALLTTEPEAELCCDRLDVLTPDAMIKDVVMEIHAPPQDLEDESRNFIRHNSGDSGVYSSEEGSGQNSRALERGEEVKLEKMGRISFRAEPAERTQDIGV